MKLARNLLCSCGSKKKYKKCCGSPTAQQPPRLEKMPPELEAQIRTSIEQQQAKELIRTQQQGLGRPIISTVYNGFRFIAVGNKLHYSKKWITVLDFLNDYILLKFGKEYFRSEISKPFEDRNPIFQWHEIYHQHLLQNAKPGRPLNTITANGIINSYAGLAYSLYLLEHNVELQERLINRLKIKEQFQGAYYETIIANSLIRTGFSLKLEDESDESQKHCEFSATSPVTKKLYSVEAKCRAVVGILGKTEVDGAKDKDATSSMTKQINEALKKPSKGERLIFIELNAEWSKTDGEPSWMDKAFKRLEAKERDLASGQSAYVFITNTATHRDLENTRVGEYSAYGLGIPDFHKPMTARLSEVYKNRQKHTDAYNILNSLRHHARIPTTFDGSLASESFGGNEGRCLIGEMYESKDLGIKGKVLDAVVMIDQATVYYMIESNNGNIIVPKSLSAEELADYKTHPEGYFG